jgi:hypothetical protein
MTSRTGFLILLCLGCRDLQLAQWPTPGAETVLDFGAAAGLAWSPLWCSLSPTMFPTPCTRLLPDSSQIGFQWTMDRRPLQFTHGWGFLSAVRAFDLQDSLRGDLGRRGIRWVSDREVRTDSIRHTHRREAKGCLDGAVVLLLHSWQEGWRWEFVNLLVASVADSVCSPEAFRSWRRRSTRISARSTIGAALLARGGPDRHASAQADDEWLIVPGQRVGQIHAASTEQDLTKAYGAATVTPSRIELGEGETSPGTIVFGTDSLRRLEVIWHDTVARARPARVIVRGSRSVWHLSPGIRIGTRLRELERYNHRAFTLAGFGWDYGGVVLDWKDGALAKRLPGIRLYLSPDTAGLDSPAYQRVLGDRDYASSSAPMQALDPAVETIFVDFEDAPK